MAAKRFSPPQTAAIVLVAATTLGAGPALAAPTDVPVTFSGFGTLAGTATGLDDADYRSRLDQAQGAGATRNPDYGVDSVFGFQARTATWNGLTGTVQMQMHRAAESDGAPSVEWANLQYQITPDFDVRGGRIVAQEFLMSDSRAVGYAQLALRLPTEIYALAPVTYLDGGALRWRVETGDYLWKFSVNAGSFDQALVVQGDPRKYEFDAAIYSAEIERDTSRLHMSWSNVRVKATSPAISTIQRVLPLLEKKQVINADLLDHRLVFDDNKVDFWNLGYVYDGPHYYLQSEFIIRNAKSQTVQSHAGYYLLAGIHLDNVTPYAQFSRVWSKLDLNELPDMIATNPDDTALVAAANAQLATIRRKQGRDDWAAGVRWDFSPNYALKFQMDHVLKGTNDQGFFVNPTADFIAGRRVVNLYSLALDFVF